MSPALSDLLISNERQAQRQAMSNFGARPSSIMLYLAESTLLPKPSTDKPTGSYLNPRLLSDLYPYNSNSLIQHHLSLPGSNNWLLP